MGGKPKPVPKMLLITHNRRARKSGDRAFGRRGGLRAGEPQVQQRGVIAQLAADVVEQVVPQQFGQAVASLLVPVVGPGAGRGGRRPLGERVGEPVLVVGLADPVGVQQDAVPRAGTEEVGAR